jgi:hypothetical protein
MLILVQFPIADLRSFVAAPDHRVPVAADFAYRADDMAAPLDPRAPGPFIRDMGPLRVRHQGIRIAGEALYFRGRRALAFEPALNKLPDPRGGAPIRVRTLFRRFQAFAGLAQGESHRLAKYELAFMLDLASDDRQALTPQQLHAVVDACLGLPVTVPQYDHPAHRDAAPLVRAGTLIARQLRWSMTAKPAEPGSIPDEWTVSARMPAVLVEYGSDEFAGEPPGAAAVNFASAPTLKFHGRERAVAGSPTQCWYLSSGVPRVGKTFDATDVDSADRQRTRNTRIAVLRQHAEREVLAYALTCLSRPGRLRIDGPHPAHAALREYLLRSAALTKRRSRQNRQLPIVGDVDQLGPAAIVVDEANPARYQQVCERLTQVLDPELMSALFAAIRHLPMAQMAESIEIARLLQAHRPKPLKLVVSYSHADDRILQSLKDHTEPDALAGVIEHWDDHAIPAGSDWAQQIDSHFAQADVVVLLLSPTFLESRYCMQVELPLALQRRAAGQTVVVPVLALACAWQGTPLAALQMVRPYGRELVACGNRADAWRCVRHEIYTAAAEVFKPH